eukprot:scaffold1384_cov110-Isochrysis_galbana.AAC.1
MGAMDVLLAGAVPARPMGVTSTDRDGTSLLRRPAKLQKLQKNNRPADGGAVQPAAVYAEGGHP